ncbi:MAG: hydroxylamine reductase [Bacteroidales bacterium]|nr:hydroxylamine reductase [Bacteroidales bacterium]
MNMFCFQCQEAAKGIGCTINGVCGKKADVAGIQDALLYTIKGIAPFRELAVKAAVWQNSYDAYIVDALFVTITNANFDKEVIVKQVFKGLKMKAEIKKGLSNLGVSLTGAETAHTRWEADSMAEIEAIVPKAGILNEANEDIRSLKELLVYGLKGMAAYAKHAKNLGYEKESLYAFMAKAITETAKNGQTIDKLFELVMACGKHGVEVMALLDEANTKSYGNPEISRVNIGVAKNPGILISGHDLKDMDALLAQTNGTGVDVYTHSEMLPANYYPAFKKYKHFVGNYGNAWWQQDREFESFNGPILMTTNCITPPKESYKDRMYTTGAAGFTGIKHIEEAEGAGQKDFSAIIEQAKQCQSPVEIETGEIIGGFAHNQVLQLADKIVEAVKTGAIKKFFVMAGCDGRVKGRDYYTDFARALPQDTVILTAGCAKYRYNKLPLGDINGIPRVLDAGQCNDSYSLAVVALKLKEVFELNNINDLPIEYNIAWYEQKAVIVLLALLFLGVKDIHLGPTLPAFLSPNVAKVLVEQFGISGIGNVEDDIKKFLPSQEEILS